MISLRSIDECNQDVILYHVTLAYIIYYCVDVRIGCPSNSKILSSLCSWQCGVWCPTCVNMPPIYLFISHTPSLILTCVAWIILNQSKPQYVFNHLFPSLTVSPISSNMPTACCQTLWLIPIILYIKTLQKEKMSTSWNQKKMVESPLIETNNECSHYMLPNKICFCIG